ncbi:MAG: DEAD/DEAH box helicase, partial [Anaerolineales bacterium]|nr:DEAD/DEAH box helicase [Anaerolineales bacterium]
LEGLEADGWVTRTEPAKLVLPAGPPPTNPDPTFAATLARLPAPAAALDPAIVAELAAAGLVTILGEPATLSLTKPVTPTLHHIYALRGATTYQRILELLAREAQPVAISAIYAATDSNLKHLRQLAKLDLIRLGSEEVWRDPLADRDFAPAEPPRLTADQARVWGRLKMRLLALEDEDEPNPPILLHGVTGSGKTEIYMRAIQHALDEGRQAMVLVPEIALTPQTVRRFAARFPGRVAVLHSRLTDGERYDTWRRARDGQIDIMVGPRSALFSPLPDVGVIVVDE